MNSELLIKYEFITNFEEEKKNKLISMTLNNIEVVLGHSVKDQFWEKSLNFLFSNDSNMRNNFNFVSPRCLDVFDKAIQMSLDEYDIV